jgi:putative ABC transport system permease protein
MAVSGTRFFTKLDDQVYVPVTAVLDQYNREHINFISITAKQLSVDATKERVRLALRDTHNLDNPQGELAKDDFRVASQEDAARSAAVIGTVLQTLLGSIAAISLVVGGIGIMNIMFVTVTERTQEIGLRKALGAKRRDVLGQFLAEALMLTILGGAIGVGFGLLLSVIAIQIINSFQEGWRFVFPMNGVILAFTVSAAIGVVFGYYPARKAARLNPIESLRYE